VTVLRIRDLVPFLTPGSLALLTPGSGMGRKSRSGMNIPDHIFESLGTIFCVKKYLHSWMRIRIRDPDSEIFSTMDPGSRMVKFGSENITKVKDSHQALIYKIKSDLHSCKLICALFLECGDARVPWTESLPDGSQPHEGSCPGICLLFR
jgi:hypothetical protein